MTEPLHIKYRPRDFGEFIGGEEIKKSILDGLGTTHTYLFHGPRGCGKTTLARLLAQELKVDGFETHEMDAGSSGGIDEIRKLKITAPLRPMVGNRKIYIIDECHLLSKTAMGGSLKLLEEPPKHVFFVLCTTEPNKLLLTIVSRSKAGEFRMKPLPRREMHKLLAWICGEEGIQPSKNVYNAILDAGEGIPRDTIGILDKVKGLKDEKEALSLIELGIEDRNIGELCRLLLGGDRDKWKKARETLKGIEEEPETVRRAILGYMNKVSLGDGDPYLPICVIEEFADNYYDSGRAGLVLSVYRACMVKRKN